MKKLITYTITTIALFVLVTGCDDNKNTQEQKDQKAVDRQQSQYAKAQPLPAFDWSLERDLMIQLYRIRNKRLATHSVWRSDYGMLEGDCASMGYGIPYDTSLTNPWRASYRSVHNRGISGVALGQAEPNGIFASTNTAATWVMCVGPGGIVEPHYIESKVTVYPGPVQVDYKTNRVVRSGAASVTIEVAK